MSLKDISSFSVLLFLLIFIYVLLGMDMMAAKNSEPWLQVIEEPRCNFDNFMNSFVLVFSVLTLELWDENMFKYTRIYGPAAILYFVSLVIVGVMIFLNLFLAILLENFEVEVEEHEESGVVEMIQKRLTRSFKRLAHNAKKCVNYFKKK